MASNTRRAELIAEIGAGTLGVFPRCHIPGWTPLTEAAHDKRAKCIADLQREFYALDSKHRAVGQEPAPENENDGW